MLNCKTCGVEILEQQHLNYRQMCPDCNRLHQNAIYREKCIMFIEARIYLALGVMFGFATLIGILFVIADPFFLYPFLTCALLSIGFFVVGNYISKKAEKYVH